MRLWVLLSALVAVIVSGCGFQLRGVATQLPAKFTKTFIAEAPLSADEAFNQRVSELLVLNGAGIVPREDATVGVYLERINVQSRQVARSNDGDTIEYERIFTTTVAVTDIKTGIQLGRRVVSATYDLQLNEARVAGNHSATIDARNNAEQTLAQKIIHYLNTL